MARRVGRRARLARAAGTGSLALALMAAAACASDGSTSLAAPTTVESDEPVEEIAAPQHARASAPDGSVLTEPRNAVVATADGEALSAREFGPSDSTDLVILAHAQGSGKESWYGFAEVVAAEGIRALAVDFRGYGESTGAIDTSLDADLVGAVSWAREGDATDIWIVGASTGGTGAIVAAASQDLSGVVTLSAPATFGDIDALSVATAVDEPSFLLVSSEDEPALADSSDLALATGEEEPTIYAGSASGMALLDAYRDDITFQLISFFKGTGRF